MKKVGDNIIAKMTIEMGNNWGFDHLAVGPYFKHLGLFGRPPFAENALLTRRLIRQFRFIYICFCTFLLKTFLSLHIKSFLLTVKEKLFFFALQSTTKGKQKHYTILLGARIAHQIEETRQRLPYLQ